MFHGCRAAAPHLIRQGAGKVINLASVLAAVGLPGYSLYAATKGGIISLTRALAVEWARHNIQVNAIAPGWFVTEMNEAAFGDPSDSRAAHARHPGPAHRPARRDRSAGRLSRLVRIGLHDRPDVFLDGGHTAA